ncbi:hypothetical protein HD806DRAFT_503162 [Xylariaceae sp. AK1471]|nr:hypothetical protein HD806DRAFT_503162 [Xylariaceae sp. AK1471]
MAVPKLQVRDNNTGKIDHTFILEPDDTVATIKQRIREYKELQQDIKIYFPGIKHKLPDQDAVITHFPNGVIINIDLVSDSEDDEQGILGDGSSNDLKIDGNQADEEADQQNYIAGITESLRGRPTKAAVTRNRAGKAAVQSNAVLDSASFKAFLNTIRPHTQ